MRWIAVLIITGLSISCKQPKPSNNYQQIEALLQRGFKSDAADDFHSSKLIYDSILEIEPNHYIALANRGRAKINTGDTASGMADLEASLKIHPTAEAFASKAMTELNGSNPRQALNDLQTANTVIPGQRLINCLLAQYYTSFYPLRDSALYYANESLDLHNGKPQFFFPIMNAYYCFNDYPHLLRTTDSIIAYFPKMAYAYNNRGLAKLNLGRVKEAHADISTSVQLDSNNAFAYRNMALVFQKMNRTDSCCYYIQKARRKDVRMQYKKDIDSLANRYCGAF